VNSVLISVIVMGMFVAVTSGVGLRLDHFGKPYGAGKLTIHIVLFFFVAAGLVASIYKLDGVVHEKFYSTVSLYITGMAVLTNSITGLVMSIITIANKKLISIHKTSTILMAFSISLSIVFLISGI
jgi:hypothetical protein